MSGETMSFESFIDDVDPKYRDFVRQNHEYMMQNNCKLKLALAKNGYVVSYPHGKKKRVIMNFVFRKSGLFARIYADHIGDYVKVLETAPEKVSTVIKKSPDCKRFADPSQCNSKCSGYAFSINDGHYQKCRYNCFLFPVDEESIPFINILLENELRCRDAE